MEQFHRNLIQRYHVKLSQTVDLERLYSSLLVKGVIFQPDLERLKVKYAIRDEQAQEFFLRYTRRGPKAFQILIDSLVETGHISEAQLLEDAAAVGEDNGYALDGDMALRRNSVEPWSASSSPKSYNRGTGSGPPSENASPKLSLRQDPDTTMDNLPPLDLQIQQATLYNNGISADECYPMMSKPRGFALIVNNLEFAGNPTVTRHGAEQDSDNLATVLKRLHFEVTVRHNVHKETLLKDGGIIDTFLGQFESTDVDCCIVSVMSHGTEGYFLTSNPEHHHDHNANRVSLSREFLPRFNNHFPPLQNKPKIFFIQACRGESRDRGVARTVTDSKDNDKEPDRSDSGSESSPSLSSKSSNSSASDRRIPTYEHFLICQSTVPGFVANRDTERGTWYIYSLCQELADRAHDTEITGILKRVSRRMRCLSSEFGEKQMSSFVNTGFHFDLFFNPGLFNS